MMLDKSSLLDQRQQVKLNRLAHELCSVIGEGLPGQFSQMAMVRDLHEKRQSRISI